MGNGATETGRATEDDQRAGTAEEAAAAAPIEHDRSGEPIGEHRRSGRLVMGTELARKMPAEATMTEDRKLLERPERRERPAFLETDTWRTLRIMSEFVEGFDALADIGRRRSRPIP